MVEPELPASRSAAGGAQAVEALAVDDELGAGAFDFDAERAHAAERRVAIGAGGVVARCGCRLRRWRRSGRSGGRWTYRRAARWRRRVRRRGRCVGPLAACRDSCRHRISFNCGEFGVDAHALFTHAPGEFRQAFGAQSCSRLALHAFDRHAPYSIKAFAQGRREGKAGGSAQSIEFGHGCRAKIIGPAAAASSPRTLFQSW